MADKLSYSAALQVAELERQKIERAKATLTALKNEARHAKKAQNDLASSVRKIEQSYEKKITKIQDALDNIFQDKNYKQLFKYDLMKLQGFQRFLDTKRRNCQKFTKRVKDDIFLLRRRTEIHKELLNIQTRERQERTRQFVQNYLNLMEVVYNRERDYLHCNEQETPTNPYTAEPKTLKVYDNALNKDLAKMQGRAARLFERREEPSQELEALQQNIRVEEDLVEKLKSSGEQSITETDEYKHVVEELKTLRTLCDEVVKEEELLDEEIARKNDQETNQGIKETVWANSQKKADINFLTAIANEAERLSQYMGQQTSKLAQNLEERRSLLEKYQKGNQFGMRQLCNLKSEYHQLVHTWKDLFIQRGLYSPGRENA